MNKYSLEPIAREKQAILVYQQILHTLYTNDYLLALISFSNRDKIFIQSHNFHYAIYVVVVKIIHNNNKWKKKNE